MTMRTIHALILATALVAVGFAALAADTAPPKHDPRQAFKESDTNGDGAVAVGVALLEGLTRGVLRRSRVGCERRKADGDERGGQDQCVDRAHRHVLSALDLPAAVGLTARRPVRVLLLAAYGDRLLVLATVLSVGELGR